MYEEKFMLRAIKVSIKNLEKGGGPFGAVIVKDGKVVAIGMNRVTCNNDPTAHAEVMVIRKAAKKLKTFNLSGCEIYTSCEPCPMCLGAIYWARIDRIYDGHTKDDVAKIGFDDSFIYQELELDKGKRKVQMLQFLPEQAKETFVRWVEKEDKVEY